MSAPRFLSAGTPTPRALCSVLPSPARLALHSDMEGAAAPAAGPDLGPGAPGSPPEAGASAAPSAATPEPRKPHGVKRHHHKHNLKHRYELQETLGKGTYGKVKRATERFSGRVVSWGDTRRARSRRGWGRSAHATGFGGAEGGLWSERGLPRNPQTDSSLSPRPRRSSPPWLRRVFLPKHLLHPVCAYFGGFDPSSKVVFMICKHFAPSGPLGSPSRARIHALECLIAVTPHTATSAARSWFAWSRIL